jgi:hypothetical protein
MNTRLIGAISQYLGQRIGHWIWTEATLAERERTRKWLTRHGHTELAELLRKERIHG